MSVDVSVNGTELQTILVTGTDTGVGKTWVTCTLLQLARQKGFRVGASKPVCSGAEFADGKPVWQDVEALRRYCEPNVPLDAICPQRFLAPVAPNVAAAQEGRHVDDALLSSGISWWAGRVPMVLVEGAGGLFCPLSDSTTVLDLARRLNSTLVIVSANRLGVISHTRLTVEVARMHGLPVAGIILNDVTAPDDCHDEAVSSNARQLRHWIPEVPLFHSEWNSRVMKRRFELPADQAAGDLQGIGGAQSEDILRQENNESPDQATNRQAPLGQGATVRVMNDVSEWLIRLCSPD